MILVDERVGSAELAPLFRTYGVEAIVAGRLDADFQFEGNGPDGPVLCGFERKALHDFLGSMRDGRLAGHQVAPMIDTYTRRYIVVEGIWRRGKDTGLVEVPVGREWRPARGSFRVAEMLRFMTSLREMGGFHILRTFNEEDTASHIAEEYHWFAKEWNEHTTHRTLYAPDARPHSNGHKPVLWRQKTTLLETWLSKLPGIDSRAGLLMPNFLSARDMANATADRWLSIKGIGPKTVNSILEAINKERE